MDTKACRICGNTKPLTDFHRNKNRRDGYNSACKRCAIEEQIRTRRMPEVIDGSKACTKCGEVKALDQFPKHRNMPGGYNHICKACLYPQRVAYEKTEAGKARIKAGVRRRYWGNPEAARDAKTENGHKVPAGTYAILSALQDGKCAICEATISPGGRRLCIDHDHNTKVIRGLLCTWCNQAIGQLRESPELFRKALFYLEKPPALHLSLTSSFQRKPDKG